VFNDIDLYSLAFDLVIDSPHIASFLRGHEGPAPEDRPVNDYELERGFVALRGLAPNRAALLTARPVAEISRVGLSARLADALPVRPAVRAIVAGDGRRRGGLRCVVLLSRRLLPLLRSRARVRLPSRVASVARAELLRRLLDPLPESVPLSVVKERKRALNGRRLNHNPRRIESGALLERNRHSLIAAKIRCTLGTTRRGSRRSRRAGRRLFHRRGAVLFKRVAKGHNYLLFPLVMICLACGPPTYSRMSSSVQFSVRQGRGPLSPTSTHSPYCGWAWYPKMDTTWLN